MLRGRDIKRWRPIHSGLFLILLQSSNDVNAQQPWAHCKNEIEAKKTFARYYPAVWDHMSLYEEALRKRSDQGKYWWELRSCTYYNDFLLPKIIFPGLSPEPRFLYDESGLICNAKGWIINDIDQWAVCLFNSKIFFVLAAANTLIQRQNNTYERGKKYLQSVPIIKPSDDVCKKLTSIELSLRFRDNEELEQEADQLIADTYGLSDNEINDIDRWIKVRNNAVEIEGEEDDDE